MADLSTQLYLISPPRVELPVFAESLKQALGTGFVPVFQLRLKGVEDDVIRRAAEALMPVCHAYDTAFLLNDRADLAAEIGADGVHLGQEDGDIAAARALLGEEYAIGVSCQDSRHKAMVAGEAGADYVSFGAFFPTATKETSARPTPALLRDWCAWTTVPAVAIGGITPANCTPLVQAGADFLAAVSYVWNHPGGAEAAVGEFEEAMKRSVIS